MADLRETKELLQKTSQFVMESEEVYKDFLETAAWNYKYSLEDKLMIFAQKPEAIACATYEVWNSKRVGRYIKRGTKGILRADHKAALFDVGDTQAQAWNKKPFTLWEFQDSYAESLRQHFLEAKGFPEEMDLLECIRKDVEREAALTIPNFFKDEQGAPVAVSKEVSQFLEDSIFYMVSARMGVLDRESFSIANFTQFGEDENMFSNAVSVISTAGEAVLREVGAVVLPLNKETPEKSKTKRSMYYGYDRIQKTRQLFNSRLEEGRTSTDREVWENASGLSAGERAASEVPVVTDERELESGSDRYGEDSIRESESVYGGVSEEESRTEEGRGSDGVGGSHEQSEASSGGIGTSGSDLPLEELSQEKIDYLLNYGTFLKHSKEEIAKVLLDTTVSQEEKLAYLEEAYNEDYTSIFYQDTKEPMLGYKRNPQHYQDGDWVEEKGLELIEGHFGSTEVKVFYSWPEVAERITELVQKGMYLDGSVPEFDSEHSMVSDSDSGKGQAEERSHEDYEIGEDGTVQLHPAFFEKELKHGIGFENGKYRVYDYFTQEHSKKEKADFLRDEYGTGGESIDSNVYSFCNHDAKGMTFQSFASPELDVVLSWTKVADEISALIAEDRYLTETEKEYLPLFYNEREGKEIASELTDFFHTYETEQPYVKMRQVLSMDDNGYGYLAPDLDGLIMNSLWKPVLLHQLGRYQETLENEEAVQKLDLILDKIEVFTSLQIPKEPSWTSLDWDLYHAAEKGQGEVLSLQEGDSIRLGDQTFSILEIRGEQYICQDEEFPLFQKELTKEELSECMREYPENDKYFLGEEQKVGNTLADRNYRLLSAVVPQILDGSTKELVLSGNDGNVLTFARTEEQLLTVQQTNTGLLMKFVLSPEEQALIPVSYEASSYGISKEVFHEDGGSDPEVLQELQVFAKEWFHFFHEQGYEVVREGELLEKESIEKWNEAEVTSVSSEELSEELIDLRRKGLELLLTDSAKLNPHKAFLKKMVLTEELSSDAKERLLIEQILEDREKSFTAITSTGGLFTYDFTPDGVLMDTPRLRGEERNKFDVSYSELVDVLESVAIAKDYVKPEMQTHFEELFSREREKLNPLWRHYLEAVDEGLQKTGMMPVSGERVAEIVNPEPLQYHIIPDTFTFGGPKARFRENIEAIQLLKTLEEEKRFATAEEQEVLFRYVGWGGLSAAFDKENGSWAKEYTELQELLSEEEYKSARESTMTAFYTPPVVISSIYEVLKNMGFENGNILEPACGTGNFMGMLPEEMEGSNLYGVELDSISGRIAKQLYQKSSIAIEGFEKTELPDQFFDVVLGNVPFGEFSVNDPKYKKENFLIHDYFFAKALDKVRPGGVVAFVTSTGTMDKKDPKVREYLAAHADLLGAIRLPNGTFQENAGTHVASDILFLQKRDRMRLDMPEWTTVGETFDGITVNQYFIDHPEMVLGTLTTRTGQYGREEIACVPVEGKTLSEQLSEAISRIHGVYEAYEMEELEEEMKDKSLPADIDIQNYGFTVIDDVVYQRRDSRMYPYESNATALNRIRGLIELRDCMRELIHAQLNDGTDAQIEVLQGELNQLYDSFAKEFGLINSRANSMAFSEDSSYYLLCSLEVFDKEENFIGKADMFSKRTVRNHKQVRHVDTAKDALAVSIAERACVDLGFMTSLLGKPGDVEPIIEELSGIIFKDPESGDNIWTGWETADAYLSGNVKEKLQKAKAAANENPMYRVNVEALDVVQPKDLDATEISVRLGATWIPAEYVTDFMYELFQLPEEARTRTYGNAMVVYSPVLDQWEVTNKNWYDHYVTVRSTYGTERKDGLTLLENCLNLKDVTVYDYYEEDGKKKAEVNRYETTIAQQKQQLIRDEFKNWIWKDMDRREHLVRLYNEKFNTMRPREYDGSHITFHGMNPEITLNPHQVDAIARILYGGNTLLAHVVGAGKTWEMVAAAMESKRLGLCNKSLIVVPNHLLKQWSSEFYQLYPAANLLVATKKDFETANRKKFCSRIATGDYDAIIIGHSQFERIPLSQERQERILEDQIWEIEKAIEAAASEEGKRISVKQMERTKKSLESRLSKLQDKERKDQVITFEELGVDRLFVDEFHFYKNLWMYTKMSNISGISQTAALKSSDLQMKCQYLDELTGYKGVIGATGTPITNSMTELYTMMRYFDSKTLDELGLSSFDAWASTFGETVTAVELAPEGTNYRAKTRFARFYNLPELMNLFQNFADIKTADMLNLPVPKANYHVIDVDSTPEQETILATLADRAEAVRNGGVDPTEDNMLKITNDGRKLALEQRLLDPSLPDDPGSKVNACVDKVFEIYEHTKEQKSTQLIFCDLSTPGKKKQVVVETKETEDGHYETDGVSEFSDVYQDIKEKLLQKGVKESEIAFIHDANTDKKKDVLFGKVRNGQVRVLLGSTFKMGAGTNVQDLLIAAHDLDCPWRPADLEQRAGRIVRQGNTNPEVDIYRYVTKNTFDAYLYQLVENKQRFISQIMTSKSPVRVADDIDEASLTFAEIKALAAGNPMIKEKMDLDIEVSKLNALKSNFLRERFTLEENVAKKYPETIANCKTRISQITADMEAYEAIPDKTFAITLQGEVYRDQKEAGKALEEILKGLKSYEPVSIGKLFGFEIRAEYIAFLREHRIQLVNHRTYNLNTYKSGVRNLGEMEQVFKSFPERIQKAEEERATTDKMLEQAEEELLKVFPYEEELNEKNARLQELNVLLNVESGAGPEELLQDAKNPNTAVDTLGRMAEHESLEIREAVAGNPSISEEVMKGFLEDPAMEVRIALAGNEQLSRECQVELAKGEERKVKEALLKREDLSDAVLDVLSLDTDLAVVGWVLEREGLPDAILERLSEHPDSHVLSKVAEYEDVSPEILDKLSHDSSKSVVREVAKHERTSGVTLTRLAESEDEWVRTSVAENPNTPSPTLVRLLDDPKSWVQSEALRNPNLKFEDLEEYVNCFTSLDDVDWSVRRKYKEMKAEQGPEVKEKETDALDAKIQGVQAQVRKGGMRGGCEKVAER